MSHTEERFASFLKKEIGQFINAHVTRNANTLLSVTKVVVNSSGEHADVFVSIFPDAQSSEIMHALHTQEKETRHHLSQIVKRRHIPSISFVKDIAQEASIRLEKILENGENNDTAP